MTPEIIITIVGWVASGVMSKLISELVDWAKHRKTKLGLEKEVAQLQEKLPKIEAVLKNVDLDLIRGDNPHLEEWLWKLRDAAEQVDDLMDEMKYNILKEKIDAPKRKAIKFKFGHSNKDHLVDQLREAVKAMDQAAGEVDFQKYHKLSKDLVEKQNEMLKSVMEKRDTGSVQMRTRVFGREKEKKYIINKLLNPEYKEKHVKYAVLPLIGAGGIGKTTLAQYVFNDREVQNHFKELMMWLCISPNMDKELLTKKLYESAFDEQPNFVNLDSMHKKLKKKLESTRFLVVLDDAWYDNFKNGWGELFGLLQYGEIGSMVLLTTREERVAKLISHNLMDSVSLGGLHEEHMWDFFKECAFGNKDPEHEELVQIGREIVNTKLRTGSPLAAETIGRLLRSNLDEEHWTEVLNSELWSLKEVPNDIMPALRLTYHYLPSNLKPCFSFCSIFPQDHVFIKDDLICMWIALGLVPRDINAKTKPEDVGSTYFEEILNRSIFSHANAVSNAHLRYPAYTYHREMSEKQFVEGYIMHDLMHDLSTFVSQGECHRCDIDKLEYVTNKVRHLFIHVGECREFKLSNSLKNVRTLILQFNDSDPPEQDFIKKLVKEMKNLRVFTLFALTLSEVPKILGDLFHLRYLSLSSCMLGVFPQSMSRLYLLETLVCGGFGFKGQADVLVNLINLRHLIVSDSFVGMIVNIGKLTSLQELSFHVGRKKSGFEISQLSDMRELRHLSINNINDVDSHEEAIEAKLREKKSLRKLSLQWDANKFNEKVFEELEPHSGLKELRIRNYMGGKPPVWLQAQDFSKLEVLSFESMWAIKDLPLTQQPKERMQCLKELTIDECLKLCVLPPLPVGLKKLTISHCPMLSKLEVLSLKSMGPIEELSLTYQPKEWMPCLKELTIDNCPKLCVLPTLPVGLKKLKLECLGLSQLPNLWEDESSTSGSLPCLISMEISRCSNLLSLAQGLLHKPEKFKALETLTILSCQKLEAPHRHLNKLISLKKLDVSGCLKINPFVLAIFLSFRSICINGTYVDLIAGGLPELSLPPTLQKEDALLFVADFPESAFVGSLRMRGYMGKWPPSWFIRKLSMLECLIIDSRDKACSSYISNRLPSPVNQLLQILSSTDAVLDHLADLKMVYHLDMPELKQFYFTTQHIEQMQYLKKLYIFPRSNILFLPPVPLTLKELHLCNLGLTIIPNLYENQRSKSGRLPSLVVLTIDNLSGLVSLAEGLLQKHEQFPALRELSITDCFNLRYLPERCFSGFVSLTKLHIAGCPMLPRLQELVAPTSEDSEAR